VPFQQRFEGAIEKYFSNDRPTLYACTAYWYLMPGGTDPYPAVPVTERVGYWETMAAPMCVEGAIEGEKLKILNKTGGDVGEQAMASFQGEWSNDAQLWWKHGEPGSRLELELPIQEAGRYMVVMQFTRAKDYGIVQCSLDGQALRWPIDLYHPTVRTFGPFDMGTLDLSKGNHTLAFEVTGSNPAAIASHMVGLDYVRLAPVPVDNN